MRLFKLLIGMVLLSGCEFVSHIDNELGLTEDEILELSEPIDGHDDQEVFTGIPDALPNFVAQDAELAELFANSLADATGYWQRPVIRSERTRYYIRWETKDCSTNGKGWIGYWNRYSNGNLLIRLCHNTQQYPITAQKVMSHEVGHMLGLGHYKGDEKSVMRSGTCLSCNSGYGYFTEVDHENLKKKTRYDLDSIPDLSVVEPLIKD